MHWIPPAVDPADVDEVPSFFQLPVLMLMLITLLNDGILISVGYDHVIPSARPEKWNLRGEWLPVVMPAKYLKGSWLL